MDNKLYLEKLIELKEHFSIKVITGMRGVGKTTLLKMFAEHLKDNDVPAEEIIFINFDETEEIKDFQQLYEFVNEKIAYLEHAYLLFDEIQLVQGWEKAINAFFVGAPVDVYIAGSNSGVLSEDFLKLLPNHYEELQIHPLPLGEFSKSFFDYMKFGSLPIATSLYNRSKVLPELLLGIYYKALLKDIVSRYSVRDAALLDSMNKFLAKNIGKPINPKKIDDYLINIGRKTTGYTMENYLQMIHESNIFCRVERYDIKTRAKINGSEQFYCADIGICNSLLNFNDIDESMMIENAVCIELWRQGYKVFVGKLGKMKVTFVAFKDSKPTYFQIIQSVENKPAFKKSLKLLQRIPDQYDKIILSIDGSSANDFNGIKHFNVIDFLTNNI